MRVKQYQITDTDLIHFPVAANFDASYKEIDRVFNISYLRYIGV